MPGAQTHATKHAHNPGGWRRDFGQTCVGAVPQVGHLGSLGPKSFPAFPCSALMLRDRPLQAVSHPPSSTGFQLDLSSRSTNKRLGGRMNGEARVFPAEAVLHPWPSSHTNPGSNNTSFSLCPSRWGGSASGCFWALEHLLSSA